MGSWLLLKYGIDCEEDFSLSNGVLYGCFGCKTCLDQSGVYPLMSEDIKRLKHLWE